MRRRLIRASGAVLFTALFLPLLAGEASAQPEPWAPWNVDYYDFGEVVDCVQCNATFTFTNTLIDPVVATSINTFADSEFQVTGDTCDSAEVMAGATCTVQVTLEEPPPGPISDPLKVNFEDETTLAPVTVPAVQLFAGGAAYVATNLDGTVNFGNVPEGDPPDFFINYFVFENPLDIVDFQPPDATLGPSFNVVSNNCTAPVAVAGEDETECTVEVNFDPTVAGVETAPFDMTFENNQTNATVWTEPLELVGTGVPPAVLPESPLPVLLPGAGVLLVAGALVWQRRRGSLSAT